MKLKFTYFLIFLFNITVWAQSDCPDAIMVCGGMDYYGLTAEGVGDIMELSTATNDCHSQEHHSVWFKIQIKDGGTLGFILTPESSDLVVDFDFWFFGPNLECGNLGDPIRCSTTNPNAAGLTYNTTGMNETEIDVSEGPNEDGNAFIQWVDVEDDDIYYLVVDRPHGFSNFSIEWTGTATFHEVPVFLNPDNIPLDIVQCDGDDGVYDQSVTFDLTVYEEMFIGDQTDVELTYHTSLNDMTLGENPMANPSEFFSDVPTQTVYLRMTNPITGCYDVLTFDVEIPVISGSSEDITLCDTNENGIQEFDLSVNNDGITGGDPDYTVTYYTSQEDAENNTGAIGPLYENQVPYEDEVIWARLNKTGESCFDLSSFTISIYTFEMPPSQITLCDNDGIDDGLTNFDLTINEDNLSGGATNASFAYYASATALQNNNPIANPSNYTNTSNPQTVYVRMTNTDTGCFATQSFIINTSSVTAGTPQNLMLCDDNVDGFQLFDLSVNQNLIQNGDTNTVVSYHTSQQNALNGVNPITSPYQNTLAYTSQTIWVRLQRTNNPDCFDITSFTISIIPLPVFNNPDNIVLDLSQCDDDGVDDQSNEFDLTAHENMFTGNQTDLVFSYYESMDDLNDGNAIANPQAYANTVNPQTIYIQIYNTVTGCYSLPESFEIEIINPVVAGEPEDLWLCDSDEDGFQLFVLSLNDELIKNSEPFRTVTYYASLEDAQNETNPLNDIHQNSVPYTGQTIWARLESTNGCLGYDIVSFTISVPHLPDIDYTIRIEDFTTHDNAIAVDIANWENFEYSLDGINYIDMPHFGNLIPGVYTIYIRSKDGCSEVSEEVVILNYPKFFTPNGDGIHETWQVFFIYFLPKSKISIFDRYGKLVSSFWGDSIGWDGMYNGRPLPSTDYWFLLELEDGRNIRGHFAMVR
ncbi:T9SS type B sorting domain-containing protein [Flavobacterium alkalisoli]|uniref:T9SS type B sorting domain-containing protein n=1 Tax=Flavobacterium alkalisoli TaxID=2602769 RepID=UPI003A92B746